MKKEKEFEAYLKENFAFDYDVQQHLNNVGYFSDWLIMNEFGDIVRAVTATILAYVTYLQSISIKTGTLNNRLNSLRKYYDCMIQLGYIQRNPLRESF